MLRHEVDRLFDDFAPSQWRRALFSAPWAANGAREWPVAPAVDLTELDGRFQITAEMPGIDPADIEVKLSEGMLTIRGEKKEEAEKEVADYHLCERRYGTFQRSFSEPDSVDPDKTEANFANGVLTLTMPRSAKARAREKKIEVKAA